MEWGEPRIPTHLWVEAEIRRLSSLGYGVYVSARGDKTGGLVIQKISDLKGQCMVLMRERDMEGRLQWTDALGQEIVSERDADAFLSRARSRDPDLWIIEIEDKDMMARLMD